MTHVGVRIVELLLDWLGMTRREQLIMLAALMILAFALYAGKQFATQPVYATLYLLLGASFCILLTTDNDTRAQPRPWASVRSSSSCSCGTSR